MFGYTIIKTAIVDSLRTIVIARDATIMDREATIGRLQRENARLLDQVNSAQPRDPKTGRMMRKLRAKASA